jgi:hypothetical protein
VVGCFEEDISEVEHATRRHDPSHVHSLHAGMDDRRGDAGIYG